jgi:hypothetical protein
MCVGFFSEAGRGGWKGVGMGEEEDDGRCPLAVWGRGSLVVGVCLYDIRVCTFHYSFVVLNSATHDILFVNSLGLEIGRKKHNRNKKSKAPRRK